MSHYDRKEQQLKQAPFYPPRGSLSIAEVSRRLCCSEQHLRNLLKYGKLGAYLTYRSMSSTKASVYAIRYDDVERYLDRLDSRDGVEKMTRPWNTLEDPCSTEWSRNA